MEPDTTNGMADPVPGGANGAACMHYIRQFPWSGVWVCFQGVTPSTLLGLGDRHQQHSEPNPNIEARDVGRSSPARAWSRGRTACPPAETVMLKELVMGSLEGRGMPDCPGGGQKGCQKYRV